MHRVTLVRNQHSTNLFQPDAIIGPPREADQPTADRGDVLVPTSIEPQEKPLHRDTKEPLVKLDHVDICFYARKGFFGRTEIHALSNLSLDIYRNQTVAVVGESGSGKTTLGKASLRVIKPVNGSVWFDGKEITNLDEGRLKPFRRRAQAVFQDPYSSINGFMNVAQIIEEPLAIHGIGNKDSRAERVRKALSSVRLTPVDAFLNKYPHTLSGGQRQRVGLARALVMEPDYIVADEPVSMIDASSRAEILYLMRDLQREYGNSYLYITHDIASAAHFSDQIAVMYLGRIVEFGPPQAVVHDPLHPYTKALIAAVPEPDPRNRLQQRNVVPGEPPSPSAVPTGCAFNPRCPTVISGTCEIQTPELMEVKPGHFVSCFLYDS